MADYGRHYEKAFQSYLDSAEVPYVPLSQLKKASLGGEKLKSFDYIVHRDVGKALLVDIKGRKLCQKDYIKGKPGPNWVTVDDVYSMEKWQESFGNDYEALFVFAYWVFDCSDSMVDSESLYYVDEQSYWFLCVYVHDYQVFMKRRSQKWSTVDLPTAKFRSLCLPFDKILRL